MDDIGGGDDTHETDDPLFGIFPDRRGDDYGDNNDTFCAVCGVPLNVLVSDRIGIFRMTLGLIRSPAPILEIETEKFRWCLDAVAFRPSSLQRGTDRETSRWHPDRNTKTERFHGDGKPLEILLIHGNFEFYQWHAPEGPRILNNSLILFPWVGLHVKCFELMQRLLEYRKTVLHLTQDDTILRTGHKSIRVPTNIDLFGTVQWPWGSRYTAEYEAAPFPIEDLVSEILYYLEPLPAESSSISAPTLQSQMNRLLIEIQQQIYQYLHPFKNPPTECSRHLASSTWKDLLLHGKLLPWLWDLEEPEVTVIDRDILTGSIRDLSVNKQAVQADMGQSPSIELDEDLWDWERLVRQLARYDSFELGGVLECLPEALLNRRRIWRLLDEARQDDTSSMKYIHY
ncbi:hypothetical protein EYB25_002402 [Talaromyces marneffei]|nr:hypothetical protein EYB25_002402 [Talaromyces marneffei]